MEFELHPMIYITSIGFPDNSQTDSPLFWMDFGIQKWKAPSQPPPRLRACEHHMSHAHAALRRRGLATRRSENWTPGNDGKRVSQKSSICRTRFCFFLAYRAQIQAELRHAEGYFKTHPTTFTQFCVVVSLSIIHNHPVVTVCAFYPKNRMGSKGRGTWSGIAKKTWWVNTC